MYNKGKEYLVEWTLYNLDTTEYGVEHSFQEIAYGETPEEAISATLDALCECEEGIELEYRDSDTPELRFVQTMGADERGNIVDLDEDEYTRFAYVNFVAKEVFA